MVVGQLKKPPLVEAILEVKWRVAPNTQTGQVASGSSTWVGQTPGRSVDPSYDLLVGRLFDHLANQYPFHERLPSAAIPSEIAPFLVQHRFRRSENTWPLIQIGPGIATLNETEGYRWSDFSKRAVNLIDTIYEIRPQKNDIVVESLLLRYIDAEPFDYSSASALDFLREKLKVNFELPNSLFQGKQINKRPAGVNLQVVYPSTQPRGVAQLKIATGNRHNQNVIIWETSVITNGQDIPNLPSDSRDWLEAAHTLTHEWFLNLIEGELLKRYCGNG